MESNNAGRVFDASTGVKTAPGMIVVVVKVRCATLKQFAAVGHDHLSANLDVGTGDGLALVGHGNLEFAYLLPDHPDADFALLKQSISKHHALR